jgi:cysteine-rich repeat protein/parallel beta-helix repeat protein
MKNYRSVLLAVAVFAASVGVSQAATITVNTTSDEFNSGGNCSIREAVASVNGAADSHGCTATGSYGSADEVIIPASATPYDLTIPNGAEGFNNTADIIDGGDIDIEKPVIIQGGGADKTTVRVTGTGDDRIFHAPTDIVATGTGVIEINSLTLTGGKPGTNGHGGAIMIFGGGKNSLVLNNCNIKDNTADKGGGGLAFENSAPLTITNTTFSGNKANDRGGGAFLELAGSSGTITNSTFSGNSDVGDGTTGTGGGGIELNTGALTIINTTIVGNSVTPAGSIGGGIMEADHLTIKNSILANNTVAGAAQNCALGAGASTTVSQGHSLSSDASCTATVLTNSSDQNGVSGAIVDTTLADNGGPTPTHALPDGSPAIDLVPIADCTDAASAPLTADQRGFIRPADGDGDVTALCDAGAVEVGCGNSRLDAGEECDDGNLSDGDGCSAVCTSEGGGTTGGTTGGTSGGSGGGGGGCSLLR